MNYFWCAIDFLQTYNGAVTAVATVFVAAFTIVLAFVTRRQAKLTTDALELARGEFNATHRPKLVGRALYMIAAFVDRRITLSFLIYNSGDAPAAIDSFKFFATVRGSDVVEFPPIRPETNEPPFSLDVGEQKRCTAVSNDSKLLFQYMDPHSIKIWAPAGADVSFEFRGDITFLDGSGKQRHCSFHRSYNFQTERFTDRRLRI